MTAMVVFGTLVGGTMFGCLYYRKHLFALGQATVATPPVAPRKPDPNLTDAMPPVHQLAEAVDDLLDGVVLTIDQPQSSRTHSSRIQL